MAGEALLRSDFYVYEHWRPDLNRCFWVGKGNGPRARKFRRNSHYNRIVAKLASLGLEVQVRMVASELSEDHAFALEKERILYWRGIGAELANKTDGGEGCSGLKFTAATIEKIRAARKAQVFSDADRAKHLAAMQRPETRARMSAAAKGRPATFQGRTHSAETKAKWSEARRGRSFHSEEWKTQLSVRMKENNPFQGKTHTAEVKRLISEQNKRRDFSKFTTKGLKFGPEHGAKISAALRGRKLSEGTKAKISAARKGKPLSDEHKAKLRKPKRKRKIFCDVATIAAE